MAQAISEAAPLAFARELSIDIFDEMRSMLDAHRVEAFADTALPLSPDFLAYGELFARAMLKIFSARSGTRLVGYAVFFLARDLNSGLLGATQNALYLDPAVRLGFAGQRFLGFVESHLWEDGADAILTYAPSRTRLGVLFQRRGYTERGTEYTKMRERA